MSDLVCPKILVGVSDWFEAFLLAHRKHLNLMLQHLIHNPHMSVICMVGVTVEIKLNDYDKCLLMRVVRVSTHGSSNDVRRLPPG